MKKRYLISLLLLICLVGCASIGGHKLTCTSIGKGPAMTIDQKYVFRYEEDTITNVEVTRSYIFDKKEDFDSFKVVIDYLTEGMKNYKNKHIKYDIYKSKNKYTTRLNVDMPKATDDELGLLGLNDRQLSKFKATLEKQGLVCK
ncbi:MAG: hypothetical protein ACOXZS_03795 [Bacilli bacterium]|jgi:hypothetical protein